MAEESVTVKRLKQVNQYLYLLEKVLTLLLGPEEFSRRCLPHIDAIKRELRWVGVKAEKD